MINKKDVDKNMGRFDELVDRRNTNSLKWDACNRVFACDDLLPMWVADSDWRAPDVVIEAIKKRVEHGVFGYTEPGEELNEAVVKWVKKRYGWEIKTDWLVYISGVVPAINVALKTFTGPGGNVVLQPPVYYPFFSSVKNSGASLIENQLLQDKIQYKMDLRGLEESLANNIDNFSNDDDLGSRDDGNIDSSSKKNYKKSIGENQYMQNNPANMMILCSPHNPVGRVWDEKELRQLADICLKQNYIIISDEIHSDLIYTGNKHVPMASISDDIAQNTITMIAPSKTFNLAGLNGAVTIIPNSEMRRSFSKTMNGFVSNGNIIGYTAMKAAYSQGDEWLEQQLKYLEENRDYTVKYIDRYIPGIKAIKPEGTYLIWLDCRGLGFNNKELEEFMVKKAKVGLDVGTWFGSGGEGFMRINIACPSSLLEDGLNRIRIAVESIDK